MRARKKAQMLTVCTGMHAGLATATKSGVTASTWGQQVVTALESALTTPAGIPMQEIKARRGSEAKEQSCDPEAKCSLAQKQQGSAAQTPGPRNQGSRGKKS
eukprot:1040059-Pelagomonas_calceolata.AAC.12